MTPDTLIPTRLRNQRLTGKPFRKPAEVVAWLGAVQAQDFGTAKWGLALRTGPLTDAAVEQAFNDGEILRTHAMRPTWHFVAPGDIRWLQMLTGPRVHQGNRHYYQKLELDAATLSKGRRVLERALRDHTHRTRNEIAGMLLEAGITATGQRLACLVMHAELDGVICSGVRRGKQFTYALLDERAPKARTLGHEEALAELTKRFFTSHGPATIRDYVWWSGLTVRDAKAGIAIVKPTLEHAVVDGLTYWFARSTALPPPAAPTAHLLPNYDEYLIAYKDRGAVQGAGYTKFVTGPVDEWANFLIVDGLFAGSWRRTRQAGSVLVRVVPLKKMSRTNVRSIEQATEAFGRFLELPATLEVG